MSITVGDRIGNGSSNSNTLTVTTNKSIKSPKNGIIIVPAVKALKTDVDELMFGSLLTTPSHFYPNSLPHNSLGTVRRCMFPVRGTSGHPGTAPASSWSFVLLGGFYYPIQDILPAGSQLSIDYSSSPMSISEVHAHVWEVGTAPYRYQYRTDVFDAQIERRSSIDDSLINRFIATQGDRYYIGFEPDRYWVMQSNFIAVNKAWNWWELSHTVDPRTSVNRFHDDKYNVSPFESYFDSQDPDKQIWVDLTGDESLLGAVSYGWFDYSTIPSPQKIRNGIWTGADYGHSTLLVGGSYGFSDSLPIEIFDGLHINSTFRAYQ